MKIEINKPSPKETDPVDQSKRNFLKGLSVLGLSITSGALTARLFEKPETAQAKEPAKPKSKIEQQPTEKKVELFFGTPDEIWQQALDNPQEFIAQQGFSIEYKNQEERKTFDQLVSNQMQRIFDVHHQNISELDKLFANVPYHILTIIEEAKAHNVPLAIALGMAMHESKCNPSAHDSIKNASGLFQLKQKTAESLGLKVSEKLDERLDPKKNSRAAMIYLKQLYKRFGRWDLATLAFNEGMGHLSHFLASLKEKNGQFILEEPTRQNIEKAKITYLSLHQNHSEQNKYPLNIEANIKLYLWYKYEKARQEQNILAQK